MGIIPGIRLRASVAEIVSGAAESTAVPWRRRFMDGNHLRRLLEQLQNGVLDIDSALERLKKLPL